MHRSLSVLAGSALLLCAVPLTAQEQSRSLDLTVNDVGISIGDSRRTVGLRLNYRDRRLEEAIGVNATIWTPYEANGVVRGIALGLPATGARRVEGLGVGIFGVGAEESLRGISVGGLGVGAGEEVRGLAIGGLGVGAGGAIRGVAIGGLGAGAGGEVTGVTVGGLGAGVGGSFLGLGVGGLGVGVGGTANGVLIGGLGAGVGGSATGVLVGGIGSGVGGEFTGIGIGGVGIGAGGRITGLTIAGIGVGAGGGMEGVQLAGIAIGSGGPLRWLSIAGIGIGASSIEGAAIATTVGAHNVSGFVLAPAYFRIQETGTMNGFNVSAFNHVKGTQQGLALGILNYARVIDGVQVGILNYAANKSPGTRLLPIINIARGN